uniref:Putative HNH homing endonuclease n=1 Tax=viral metagenome TaxID=1070528 RepID=A0A6M3L0M9_9ZZZZ
MSNEEKSKQLGMPFGTASGKLRKMVLFELLQKHDENYCYRCGEIIENCDDLSIEHKKAWLHNDVRLFWDLTNIAFSHLNCNILERRVRQRNLEHGTATGYRYGCRCGGCILAHKEDIQDYRTKRSTVASAGV